MNYHLIGSILFLLILGLLGNVIGFTGYKWVPFESGDPLPKNIVSIQQSKTRYVGRARHFDEILPAEITAGRSTTLVSSCHKEIEKKQFEILTVSDACEWKSYSSYENIDETAVRVGTASNGEPIYIGTSDSTKKPNGNSTDNNAIKITSIYLTKRDTYTWFSNITGLSPIYRFLSCNIKDKWIDSSSTELPNNTVSGGISENGDNIFVARLKKNCDVVTGQVIPELRKATAFLNDDRAIEAAYCQVLVGQPKEYTWAPSTDGEIPDYAVVHGKNGLELSYIAIVNKTIRHLTYSEAIKQQYYNVLIRNQYY